MTAIFAASIGVAFLDAGLAKLTWLLILPVSLLANREPRVAREVAPVAPASRVAVRPRARRR